MSLSAERVECLRGEATSALVCLPFLDTDQREEEDLANEILAQRGYPRLVVRALRLLAGIGLWYRVVLWEDIHLDFADVVAGYGLMAGVLGLLALLVSWMWAAALLAAAAVLLLVAWLGWRRFPRGIERGRDAA